jgi:hypothetical protein
MRLLLIALLMALLPVRGWIGEVMATEMASRHHAQLAAAPEKIAEFAHPERAGGDFDHESAPSHHTGAADAGAGAGADCLGHGDPDAASPHAGCDNCAACQACHTLALAAAARPLSLPRAFAPPHSPLIRFASADLAPSHKPPIR